MLTQNQGSVVGSRDETVTNLETMGAQLHELCKYQPDGLSKIQSVIAKYPNAAMHRDSDGRTALHVLCAHRPPLQSVAFLAANPMSCLQQTTKGMLPLHYACRNHASVEVVDFLLGQCPETIRMANSSGWLALHLACARGASIEVIKTLVDAWPDSVRQTTNDGRMALHFACANHAPLEVVELLVLHCREALSIQDQNEWAPLHIASAYSESLDVIAYLALECPDVLQSRGNLERLPIHVACWEGQQLPIVEFLVQACPVSLLQRDMNHLLPLHCACLGSADQQVIEFLIEQCPDSVLEIGLTVEEVARHVFRESGHTAPPLALCQWLHRIQPALLYDGPPDETVTTANQTVPDIPTSRNSPSPTENATFAPEGPESHPPQTPTTSDDEVQRQNEEQHPATTRRPRRANRAAGQQQQQQQQQQQPQAYEGLPKKLPPDVVIAGQQLHKACEAPQSLSEIMQVLAETPAAIEITTYGNALPIHTAALNQASAEILKVLLRLFPASLLQADSEGNLPIHLACYSGASIDSIKLLVKECPESLKWKNVAEQTPLEKAMHPFLDNPDAEVISFLENEMSDGALSPVENQPLPQGTVGPPAAIPKFATNPIEQPLSQAAPSSSSTDGQISVLGQKTKSLQPPTEFPLGNPPKPFARGPVIPKPLPVTRSFTTPTGWARNVQINGPPEGNMLPAPPQFHGQGNLSHPPPLHVKANLASPPPQMNIDPYFRDCAPPRVPASPSASPLRGGGRTGYAAPNTPSQKNRAPSPSPAQRKLPSPAIIFGSGKPTRSRSRSPSPSPMMRGIAGLFRRKGGNNSRNSSPARGDNNSTVLDAEVVLATASQVQREFNDSNSNNNTSSNNTAPRRFVGLPDVPFMNEMNLPSLQTNLNGMAPTEENLTAFPNRPASVSGSNPGCFSNDEMARLRGQDYQLPMSRGGAGVNQPTDVGMTMNANSSTVPTAARQQGVNNNTAARVFQRPQVLEAGTLTDRAFRPGAVAVNEPVLRPDSALYRAANTARAPSPVPRTFQHHHQQQGGITTAVPQPYRPGFSHSPLRVHTGAGDMDEPDIVVMPIDNYPGGFGRSRSVESSLPVSGMERDSFMEIIRMQEMALIDGLRSSGTAPPSSTNEQMYASNVPTENTMRPARQDNGRGAIGASPNQGEVVDRRLATIEAANIGSFYRSAIVSGDVAPIDYIPVGPDEDEEASIMPMNMAGMPAFGPPRSPPSSFVEENNDSPQENPSLTPTGASGRVNRWAVMTGSPAARPGGKPVVSSFYRDAMRTAEEQTTNIQRGGDHRVPSADDRLMVSSFYRAAIMEASNQGGNHDRLLAGIEE